MADCVVVVKMTWTDSALCSCCRSDEEMEEAPPIEAQDSDYDPSKLTKKEVCGLTRPAVTTTTAD